MIQIHKLSHRLGQKCVLNGIDLTVPDNTVLGIVGINGAGKSTLLRLLAGVYRPDEGTIRFDGQDPAAAQTRQNIFFLPDDPYCTAAMTPEALFDFYKVLYPLADREIYRSLLGAYQLEATGKMRNFSKGMRRQVFIALALAVKPKYLLLDEAFDGLDPLSRQIFKDAVTALVNQGRTTVLIASHSLRELEGLCHRFVCIDRQQIKTPGDLTQGAAGLCKFELAFTQKVDEQLFAHLPLAGISLRGRFVQLLLKGTAQELRPQLEALAPAVMDELPLDFEEAFLQDAKKEEWK